MQQPSSYNTNYTKIVFQTSTKMPTKEEIAAKLAETTGKLTAGGTNAQMKEWYTEYKQLYQELKDAKAKEASKATENKTTDTKAASS